MKQIITSALLLLLVQQGYAQTSERIQINAGNFVVPQKEPWNMFIYPFIRNIGISHSHQLKPHIKVRAGYNQWFRLLNIGRVDNSGYKIHMDGYLEPSKQPQNIRIGDINAHYNYRSIDLSAIYQFLHSGHHELYTGIGISYTWGWYSEYTGIYNEPGYPDWLFELTKRKHQDFGLIAEFGYNYLLFHKRVNIGVSETVKGYTTLPFQFYTNINIGYNFNWKTKKNAGSKQEQPTD